LGRDPVRLRGGIGETVMLTGPVVDAVGVAESVAWMVTVTVPAVVGVPLTTQPADKVSPAGRVPAVRVQV
jgi:hypothetical protein